MYDEARRRLAVGSRGYLSDQSTFSRMRDVENAFALLRMRDVETAFALARMRDVEITFALPRMRDVETAFELPRMRDVETAVCATAHARNSRPKHLFLCVRCQVLPNKICQFPLLKHIQAKLIIYADNQFNHHRATFIKIYWKKFV